MTKKRIKEYAIFIFLCAFFVAMMSNVCAQTKKLNAEQAAKTRAKLIEYSRDYLGCPYRSGSIGPATFDCSGFVYSMFRESVGIQLPRKASAIYSKSKKISDDEREAGDLVFFSAGSSVNHVGIYLGGGMFIHSASDGSKTGVIESSLSERYWKNHYTGAGRYIDSAEIPLQKK